MADEQTRAAKGSSSPAPGEAARDAARDAASKEDPTFPRERLIDEAHARFAQPSHVVAGAIAGISKKNLTEAEVNAAVEAFLVQEVK